MEQIKIVVADIDYLEDMGKSWLFLEGEEDKLMEFVETNVGENNDNIHIYPLDVFIQKYNDGDIDTEETLIRKITK